VSVVGTSGSGKSWLAARLAGDLGVSHLELDALRHQPDWVPLPDSEFVQRVSSFVTGDAWVVDGNYFDLVTEPVVWPAADTVVWIDLPKATVIRQVLARTLKRWTLRQELWNGNREKLRDTIRWDPQKSIVRWTWESYDPNRERYAAAMSSSRWKHLKFIRLGSHQEMRRLLEGVDRSK
jgi:adenylate kinase family enzyme